MKTPDFSPGQAQPSILLVDGHLSTSNLLAHFLTRHPCGYRVVGQCRAGEEALRACREKTPELVIMDGSSGDPAPRDLVLRLRRLESAPRILLFARWSYPDFCRSLVAAGVHGIVFKEDPLDRLVQAIGSVLGGGFYFSPAMEMPLFQENRDHPSLTDREEQALCLIAKGFSTKEMADRLGIAVKTAEKYRERMMNKLQLHDAVRLTHFAIRNGLVSL
ncbi:MAG TPA: response regulator transcription factor [Chthoniobacteraceae bacterium]|nr:response regulator transcription factor [Chthoniobacteraceae bacterium]